MANSDNNNSGGVFLAGAILGGLLGTLTGILIAPRSGQETRRILKKSADALPEIAEDLSILGPMRALESQAAFLRRIVSALLHVALRLHRLDPEPSDLDLS